MSRSPPSEINAEPSVAGGYEAPGNEDPGTERQNSPEKKRFTWCGPGFIVRHPRDWEFIDPATHLDSAGAFSSAKGKKIALVGLAGVGKSALAIEYCYRIKDQSPKTWVFWIDARSRTRFEQRLQYIAQRYEIPGRLETVNIVHLVLRWLESKKKGNWVIVFDGVEDVELARLLAEHIPNYTRSAWRDRGSLVVTMRSEEVALAFVAKEDVVLLDPMDEAHALALLGRKLDMSFDSIKDAKELVAALEYIPLAIVQAAAYINRARPQCSLRQYLDKLKDFGSKGMVLDQDRFNQDVSIKTPILSTCNISFDYLWQNRPSATDLLSLMSCADHQIIPDFLLRFSAKVIAEADYTDDTASSQTDERNGRGLTRFDTLPTFGKDIRLLSGFSIITASAETFDIAEPVQLATQAWLKTRDGQLDCWRQEFVSRMDAVFPYPDDYNVTWDLPRILLPHVPAILAYRPTDKTVLNRWSNVASRAGRYALIAANLFDAQRLLEAALEAQKSTLGLAHDASFDTASNLSTLYVRLKEESKLRDLWKQSLDNNLEVLGAGHPRTRTVMEFLMKVNYAQRRWEDAEILQKQLIERSEASLGATHPETLEARDWLASIWERQDRLVEAETLWKELIETLKGALGREHADVLEKSRDLALFYGRQGRWTDAEALQVSVMNTCRRVLGTGHQLTLKTMHDLTLTYRRRGRTMNATALLFLVIWLRKDTLGSSHPDTRATFDLMREWNPQFTRNMVPSRAAILSDAMVNQGV